MKLHWLQHVPFEGLGAIASWALLRGHELSATRLFAGEQTPAPEAFDRLIVMGGPMGVHDTHAHPWLNAEKHCIGRAIESGTGILGICLGAQLLADALGARVYPNRYREIGWFPIELTEETSVPPLFADFPRTLTAFHWHGDTFDIPAGAHRIAGSQACGNQIFVHSDVFVALQCHLETTEESVEQLLTHCRDEIIEAPYVQAPEELRAAPASVYSDMHVQLFRLLDRWAEAPAIAAR